MDLSWLVPNIKRLGKEAQQALGIPQDRILPIKKMITGFPQTAEAMTDCYLITDVD